MNSYCLLLGIGIITSLIGIIYHKIEETQDLELSKNLIKFFIIITFIKIVSLLIFINRGMTICLLGKTIFC